MMERVVAICVVWVLMVVLAACTVAPRDETPGRTPEEDFAGAPGRQPDEGGLPPAVAELVRSAENATMAGEHERAAVQLERAIRIAPRNAVLWQNLAVVRYRQERFAQAESLALKSNSLTADTRLKLQNWSLIAEARRSAGNQPGASEAQARAQRLREQSGLR
jgi:predicted Zn-dependent protease